MLINVVSYSQFFQFAWGCVENIDAIIYATGYRLHLDYLADLGDLDADAKPTHRRGISTTRRLFGVWRYCGGKKGAI